MNTFKLHLFVCFVAILVSNCCVSLAVHFISGKHDASALGNGISAKRGNINPAAVISVLFLVSYLYFTKKYYNQHLLSPSTFEMINEKLLRENGNLKDLVVQTSADLEREKSNQDNLVHHNELINSDNAALQSRVEELLSVIDRQRRELAGAYKSSQRMAFEESVAWREVLKQSHVASIRIHTRTGPNCTRPARCLKSMAAISMCQMECPVVLLRASHATVLEQPTAHST